MKTTKLQTVRQTIAILLGIIPFCIIVVLIILLTPILWFGNDITFKETREDLI